MGTAQARLGPPCARLGPQKFTRFEIAPSTTRFEPVVNEEAGLARNTEALAISCGVAMRPVGVLLMEDEAGGDEKIIAVPSSKLTQRYDKVRTYSDLPDITLQQIQHFFEHYKDLEKGKWVKVLRWGGAEDAHRLILEGIERAKK